jgi:hypothetical protein
MEQRVGESAGPLIAKRPRYTGHSFDRLREGSHANLRFPLVERLFG